MYIKFLIEWIDMFHPYIIYSNLRTLTMYVDEYVIAGLIIVALTIGFFGGVYRFIKLDIAKHANDNKA